MTFNISTILLNLLFFAANHIAFSQQNEVVTWGRNDYGQLNKPIDLDSVVEITAGLFHTLALRSDSTVVAWGGNDVGQCDVPIGLDSVIAIEAGYYHSMALKSNGSVVVWGRKMDVDSSVINGLEGLDSVIAISLRNSIFLALRSNGKVLSWGDINNIPGSLDSVIAIAAGTRHAVALKNNGTVVVWGKQSLSVVPDGVDSIIAIAAGSAHTLTLDKNGKLFSWGEPGFAQSDIPVGLSNIRLIAAGSGRSMVLKQNGDIVVGLADGRKHYVPKCMKNVKSIAAGLDHYVALTNKSFFATVDKHKVCDSLTWIDGKTYTESNTTALFTYVNGDRNGCDSTVRLDLTLANSTGIDVVKACDSIIWIDGNTTLPLTTPLPLF